MDEKKEDRYCYAIIIMFVIIVALVIAGIVHWKKQHHDIHTLAEETLDFSYDGEGYSFDLKTGEMTKVSVVLEGEYNRTLTQGNTIVSDVGLLISPKLIVDGKVIYEAPTHFAGTNILYPNAFYRKDNPDAVLYGFGPIEGEVFGYTPLRVLLDENDKKVGDDSELAKVIIFRATEEEAREIFGEIKLEQNK